MSASIPKTVALFETTLASQAVAGDTSITLTSVADIDGNSLASGLYAFTLDGNVESRREYCIGTLSSTTVSSIFSISAQNVATSGLSNFHSRGASVAITDWVAIGRLTAAARGDTGYDSSAPLFYDGNPTFASDAQIVTKKYVDDLVNGGAVSYNQLLLTTQTAGENLTANDFVYFKESDQRWYKVDADLTSTFSGLKLGYAASTQTTGNTLSIVIMGLLTGFVGLTAGSKYYASNTAGAISTTPGTYGVYAGTAKSTTVLIVDQYVRDIPTGAEKDALAGSQGIPNSNNKYMTQDNMSASTTDQSQLTVNGTSVFGAASTTGLQNRLAQSFIPTKTKIRGANLYKQADTGTFTGTVTIALQADSSGSPDGVDLATVTLTNNQWVALPAGEFEALFSSEYASLTVGSLYWLVARTSTADTANHPNLGVNNAGGYGSGSVKYFNTTDSWVAIPTIDLYFATLEGNASQGVETDSGGTIPDDFYDKDTLGFKTTVGALSPGFVKSYWNAYIPFMLWTGATDGAVDTQFDNWIRSSSTLIEVTGMGNFANFVSTNAASIYLSTTSGPFIGADGAIVTFAKNNVVIGDWNLALNTADEGVFMGFSEAPATSGVAAYNATATREVAFVYNGTTLYAKTSNATSATLTQISGITSTLFNNFRIEMDLGADTANFYVNGVLVATIAATFPGTSGTVSLGFGRQDDALFTVSAPYVAVEMNP